MAKIINATPHTINFYSVDQVTEDKKNRKLILDPGAQPWKVIEPSGKLLNAVSQPSGELQTLDDIPLETIEWVSVDSPWDVFGKTSQGDWFIVSNMYRAALCDLQTSDKLFFYRPNLVTVGDIVFHQEGDRIRPCGCLSLIKG